MSAYGELLGSIGKGVSGAAGQTGRVLETLLRAIGEGVFPTPVRRPPTLPRGRVGAVAPRPEMVRVPGATKVDRRVLNVQGAAQRRLRGGRQPEAPRPQAAAPVLTRAEQLRLGLTNPPGARAQRPFTSSRGRVTQVGESIGGRPFAPGYYNRVEDVPAPGFGPLATARSGISFEEQQALSRAAQAGLPNVTPAQAVQLNQLGIFENNPAVLARLIETASTNPEILSTLGPAARNLASAYGIQPQRAAQALAVQNPAQQLEMLRAMRGGPLATREAFLAEALQRSPGGALVPSVSRVEVSDVTPSRALTPGVGEAVIPNLNLAEGTPGALVRLPNGELATVSPGSMASIQRMLGAPESVSIPATAPSTTAANVVGNLAGVPNVRFNLPEAGGISPRTQEGTVDLYELLNKDLDVQAARAAARAAAESAAVSPLSSTTLDLSTLGQRAAKYVLPAMGLASIGIPAVRSLLNQNPTTDPSTAVDQPGRPRVGTANIPPRSEAPSAPPLPESGAAGTTNPPGTAGAPGTLPPLGTAPGSNTESPIDYPDYSSAFTTSSALDALAGFGPTAAPGVMGAGQVVIRTGERPTTTMLADRATEAQRAGLPDLAQEYQAQARTLDMPGVAQQLISEMVQQGAPRSIGIETEAQFREWAMNNKVQAYRLAERMRGRLPNQQSAQPAPGVVTTSPLGSNNFNNVSAATNVSPEIRAATMPNNLVRLPSGMELVNYQQTGVNVSPEMQASFGAAFGR